MTTDTGLKRKLAAILVADVVGYSRLIADDEEATLRRLEVFRSLWQDCLAKTGGRIFNTAGDAVLAEFQSAVEAVRCALDFQAQAKTQNDSLVPKRQMHFRVGITVGDVVERRGDLLGDGVNIAARLQTLAGPGGICVSSWVRESVANKLGVKFTDLGDQTVKNIPTPIRAYVVGAAEGAEMAAIAPPPPKTDWLSRAATSWRGSATVLGLSAVGILAVTIMVAQMRPGKPGDIAGSPPPAGPAKGDLNDIKAAPAKVAVQPPVTAPAPTQPPPAAKTEPPKTEPVKTAPQPTPVSPPPMPVTPAPAPTAPASSTPPRFDPTVRLGQLTEAVERDLKSGDRFKECDTCLEMVVLPRGDFIMGTSDGQPGHEPDEAPAHKVTIATRLAVSRYAVSVADYQTFVAVTGYRPGAGCRVFENGGWVDRRDLSYRDPGFKQSADHPAVCVNWNDAKAYTDWMTARMNGEYRLPTEAEREFFTRAGSVTMFWWGNEIAPTKAAYDWNETLGSSPRAQPHRGTQPVNAFQVNPWGLFQVHGNVSEWVEDCWNDSYRGAPADGSAWTIGDCSRRVLRGGSWGYVPKDLRASYREGATLTNRNFNFGFRVVRVLRGSR